MILEYKGIIGTERNPSEVFKFLSDPVQFAKIFPGFREVRVLSEKEFIVYGIIAVGPLRGNTVVKGRIVEVSKDSHIKVHGVGEGVDSRLEFNLELWITGVEHGSKIEWNFRGELSGLVSLLGERTVDRIAHMIVEEIVEGIRRELR